MKRLYEIGETIDIDISDWKTCIDNQNFSEDVKNRLEYYITDRSKDFKYEKSVPYKFYILKEKLELPIFPRPPKNNSGGWYYRLVDLLNNEDGIVRTIRA
ncbi:hypothetical protein AM233_19900 [Bacillus sp. FJAT-22058]|nr:hypothetical protein AM233_19900 [Bacillus sp. FJAT-22058]